MGKIYLQFTHRCLVLVPGIDSVFRLGHPVQQIVLLSACVSVYRTLLNTSHRLMLNLTYR